MRRALYASAAILGLLAVYGGPAEATALGRIRFGRSAAEAPPPPDSCPAAPASVTAKAWGEDVWCLQVAGATGARATPTKTLGVNNSQLPAGAAFSPASLLRLGTCGSPPCTFSGWTIPTGYTVAVYGSGWIIEDNVFRDSDGDTYALNLQSSAADTIIRYNTFDGDYGRGFDTAVNLTSVRSKFYRNTIKGAGSDTIKLNGADTVLADRNEIYENYVEAGAWTTCNGPHFDAIQLQAGGGYVHDNLWDMTYYANPDPSGTCDEMQNPPVPVNDPPADAPAGRYTYGFTNLFRVECVAPCANPIDRVDYTRNIGFGMRRGTLQPIAIGATGIGTVNIDDNVLQCGITGLIYYAASTRLASSFTSNTDYDNGYALGNSVTGFTSVAPGAPNLTEVDSITTSSARVIFDQPCDYTAQQYAISSTSATEGFGAWTSLTYPNSGGSPYHTISGLSSGVTYWVKVRAVNANGNGAESNVLSFTTD